MDMYFIFSCSTRYLTSERSERVRYRVEHEKIKFISISGHVIFCLLYKHTYDDVIDYCPRISDHFAEISEDFPKFVRRPDERFRTFSEHFPKITEDFRRLPKIAEEEPIIETLRSRFGDLTTNGKPCFAVSGFTLAVCPYLGLRIGWLNSRLPCLFSFVRSLLF